MIRLKPLLLEQQGRVGSLITPKTVKRKYGNMINDIIWPYFKEDSNSIIYTKKGDTKTALDNIKKLADRGFPKISSGPAVIIPLANGKYLIVRLDEDKIEELSISSPMRLFHKPYNFYYIRKLQDAIESYNRSQKSEKQKEQELKNKETAWKKYWDDNLLEKPAELNDRATKAIPEIRKLITGIDSVDDQFDKELESALKIWQKKYKLPETGKWDPDTRDKVRQLVRWAKYDWSAIQLKPNELKKAKSDTTSNDSDDDSTTSKDVPAIPFRNKSEGNVFRAWVNDNHTQWAQDNNLDRSGAWKEGQKYFKDYMLKAWNEFGKEYMDGNNYKEIEEKPIIKKDGEEVKDGKVRAEDINWDE